MFNPSERDSLKLLARVSRISCVVCDRPSSENTIQKMRPMPYLKGEILFSGAVSLTVVLWKGSF